MKKEADLNIVLGTGLTFWLQLKVEEKLSSLWISKDLRRIKTFTGEKQPSPHQTHQPGALNTHIPTQTGEF